MSYSNTISGIPADDYESLLENSIMHKRLRKALDEKDKTTVLLITLLGLQNLTQSLREFPTLALRPMIIEALADFCEQFAQGFFQNELFSPNGLYAELAAQLEEDKKNFMELRQLHIGLNDTPMD